MMITMYVYASLGFKQIISEEEEEENQVLTNQRVNFHPDDKIPRKTGIICVAFSPSKEID